MMSAQANRKTVPEDNCADLLRDDPLAAAQLLRSFARLPIPRFLTSVFADVGRMLGMSGAKVQSIALLLLQSGIMEKDGDFIQTQCYRGRRSG